MKYLFSGVGALVALALFISVNVLSNTLLRNQSLDLTEHRLFTLSEGSRTIAAKLDEPIHLYFYYSKDVAAEIPTVPAYYERVRSVLESYERHSGGMLILEERNPESYSEAEEQAAAHGITGADAGAALEDTDVKARLKQVTDDALARGIFGSPTVIVDGEAFWGNDRLWQVKRWLDWGGW